MYDQPEVYEAAGYGDILAPGRPGYSRIRIHEFVRLPEVLRALDLGWAERETIHENKATACGERRCGVNASDVVLKIEWSIGERTPRELMRAACSSIVIDDFGGLTRAHVDRLHDLSRSWWAA